MRKLSYRRTVFKLCSLLLLTGLLLSSQGGYQALTARAQTVGSGAVRPASALNRKAPPSGMRPQVTWASGPFVSRSLGSMVSMAPQPPAGGAEINPRDPMPLPKSGATGNAGTRDASILQSAPLGNSMPAPIANFDGVAANGYLPPDTEGDIGTDPATGKSYYMQWVNVKFQIWAVTNPVSPISLLGPVLGSTLFSGMPGLCGTNDGGDPIVLFDHLANRWFASQLAYNFAAGALEFHQCVAVSTSGDPTSSWIRYDFLWGSGNSAKFNDYPKFGVWPDGYYMTVNEFTEFPAEAWAGAGVAVLDRNAMLAGNPASMQRFDLGAVNINFGNMLPSDLDGPAPAAGTPNYFSEWDDSTWLGDANDTLRIWEFHVDWVTPANTTFGLSGNPNELISTSNVDPNMCGYSRNCIPQPGSGSPTFWPKLDAISDRIMHRLAYRNFGAYQTLVGNHTVDATSQDQAGIHWFELRDNGSGWGIQQQGVYSPDSDNRWMGSIAMDTNGDIALGYSVSSLSTYPAVRYTGRLASDPLGTLPQGETSLIAGGGSQTSASNRWGDYSMMSVDPTDDCTFWYTQEYYSTTSSSSWKTRIGSFNFPNCHKTVTQLYPPDSTQACLRPQIGVTLWLSDLLRPTGSFDPNSVSLTLDGSDVTAAARVVSAMNDPQSLATLFYAPPGNLALGAHQAAITYPSWAGIQSRQWNFTVADIACALSAPPAAGSPNPQIFAPVVPQLPTMPFGPVVPQVPVKPGGSTAH